MKNKILFLLIVFFPIYSQAVDPISAWARNNFPINYVMDQYNTPVNTPNTNSSRIEMIGSVDEWNQNGTLGSMVYITQGAIDNSSNAYELSNNINEIKFLPWNSEWPTRWAANTQNLSTPLHPHPPCSDIITPKEKCLRVRYESDIYFNPFVNSIYFFIGDSVPSRCSGLTSANSVLRHEIGHGLGVEHFGSQLMAESKNI